MSRGPQTYTERLDVRLRMADAKRLKALVERLNTDKSDLIRRLIEAKYNEVIKTPEAPNA